MEKKIARALVYVCAIEEENKTKSKLPLILLSTIVQEYVCV